MQPLVHKLKLRYKNSYHVYFNIFYYFSFLSKRVEIEKGIRNSKLNLKKNQFGSGAW